MGVPGDWRAGLRVTDEQAAVLAYFSSVENTRNINQSLHSRGQLVKSFKGNQRISNRKQYNKHGHSLIHARLHC